WKYRHNITLNYGVRWEINPAATTRGGDVLRATSPIQAGPTTFAPADTWYDTSKWGVFGPRLGLAWSPDYKNGFMRKLFGESGRSVVRLGYGIAYDTISSFQVTAAAGRVPGLLVSCSSTWSTAAQNFGAATNGCITPPNLTIAGGFPTVLPAPTRRPSEFLTPPIQRRTQAPPITVFAPEMKVPTVHQWSLSVQRELPGGFVAQVAYLGRAGNRLYMAYDINQINVGPILPSYLLMQENFRRGCLPSGSGALPGSTCTNPIPASQIPLMSVPGVTASVVDATGAQGEVDPQFNNIGAFARRLEDTPVAFANLRLRPNQQFSAITYLDNSGASNYHAGQFTLRRRFAGGLGLNLAYSFQKSIDNQSVDPVGAASGGGLSTTNSRTPRDIRNFREERGRSDFDRRHSFSVASVWELPVGHGRRFLTNSSGWVNQILGGWSINSIFNAMSGEPFSVRSGLFTANGSHESYAVVIDPTVRAQLQEIPGVIGPVVFRNEEAFAVPAPGRDGSGRNIFTSAAYWNLDMSFLKTFRVTERLRVQFRTEMFNILNRTNFDNPRDASVGSPSIQSQLFAQTCCAGVAPPSTQTIVQTGESARVIQFALKVQF
ncbi:MAG TPA: hypothetical protein VFH31_04285, partial [Pyrinomonadaceae bacterium]|nr:hypothetical protein [Pyrinomonadaceae bacterium]